MSVESLMKISDVLFGQVAKVKAEYDETQHRIAQNFHNWFNLELIQFCQKWGVDLEIRVSELLVHVPYSDAISKNETTQLHHTLCYMFERVAGDDRLRRSTETQRFMLTIKEQDLEQSQRWCEFEQELISLYSIKLDFEQRVQK